jgi:hypothetical protein
VALLSVLLSESLHDVVGCTSMKTPEDELSHKIDDALVKIEQLHHSLPPLDRPPKTHDREHLDRLGNAVREYYRLLKKAKERWEDGP